MNYSKRRIAMIVAYDFDGVICDVMPALERHFFVKYNHRIQSGEPRHFNFDIPAEITPKDMYGEVEEAILNYQEYMLPHAFAFEYLRRIHADTGQVPIIITSRRPSSTEVGRKWMNAHYYGDFEMYGVSGAQEKLIKCEELGVTHYVDDRLRNVGTLAEYLEKVYFMNRSWNWGREIAGEAAHRVLRVNNLADMYDDLKDRF
jgi:uncharacterized HAD superfamily protein